MVKHDIENKKDKKDKEGRTLKVIIEKLQLLGYKVNWKVLDASEFGLPQARKRIFIVGSLNENIELTGFAVERKNINRILENGLPPMKSKFADLLLKHFSIEELYGKSIKDKRGGEDNIHSWDIEFKGSVTKEQITLLNNLFKEKSNGLPKSALDGWNTLNAGANTDLSQLPKFKRNIG